MVAESGSGRVTFKFTGDGLEIAILILKNLFFTIITIGIYRPWATTNMRRYVWGHMTFLGDRANYTGTGKELFHGWLKLFGLFFVLYLIVSLLSWFTPFLGFLILPVYAIIFGLAIYSGLRYRLSRTTWRQIRFGADKNEQLTKEFMKQYLMGAFLTLITLGIYTPWFKSKLRRFLTDKSRFGTMHFSYTGDDGEYAGVFWKGFLFTILTLGIYGAWWMRDLIEYRWKHTKFMGHAFSFDLKGWELFKYGFCAYLVTIITLGLAGPWMFVWGLKLFAEHMHLEGTPDFSLVQAQAADGSAMADDIVDGYDLDIGF